MRFYLNSAWLPFVCFLAAGWGSVRLSALSSAEGSVARTTDITVLFSILAGLALGGIGVAAAVQVSRRMWRPALWNAFFLLIASFPLWMGWVGW
ncbi:MAG: hypothetical protein COV76_02850 [Candidatus Omnitrophica bacterium CG11_big_fil_rev_8_21_14_0_20_64_10]|nr:MAG: hypothetical protein COV76_02850 [Candidatus Omnitrophica bacterium CG11_big_fil_rev_8_21_14_0_20_64_10]